MRTGLQVMKRWSAFPAKRGLREGTLFIDGKAVRRPRSLEPLTYYGTAT